jgi:asparagine synthase (glutamine-hydrolysing)
MWKAFQRINWTSDHDVTSPNPWFSGDGGSVGLGHVYIDPDHVERIRDGDIESFCRYALDQRGLPFNWFYKKKVFDTLRRLVENDIRNELERIPNAEPGRRFHLWLMDNDQRRHLHSQFENIDHSRREHLTPFFDTEFMKAVITIPVDRCLLHEFYHEWMKRLPAAVSSTPWQAYPTHLPCPIPLDPSDAKARNQWETDRQDEWARAEPFAAHARRIVFGPTFAGAYLRRDRVLAGLSLNALHLKSVIGGLRTVSEYAGFLEKCEGRISPLS